MGEGIINGKCFASPRIGRFCKSYSNEIDFLGSVFAIIMCYFAFSNIYEFQQKPNDYQIYDGHYLVRGSVKNMGNCQYFEQLNVEDNSVINIDDKANQFFGLPIHYSSLSKGVILLIVALDFFSLIVSNISLKWGLKLYVVSCFLDLVYTLQSPLITNINYGKHCIETSPLLNIFAPQFLLATKGNLWIMLLVTLICLPMLQANCQKEEYKLGGYLAKFQTIILTVFLFYCLFYYITSFWTNTLLCNLAWLFNTLFDYLGYCLIVEGMQQQRSKLDLVAQQSEIIRIYEGKE